MPGLLKTVFNNGGVPTATSADDFYQRQRLANQQSANENARLQAQLQDAAANRALQLQTAGSYGDRARDALAAQQAGFTHAAGMANLQGDIGLQLGEQAGQNALATTRAGNEPQIARLNEDARRFNLGREDTAPQRELANAYGNAELGIVRNLFNAQGPAVARAGVPGVFQDAMNKGAPSGSQPMNQDQAILQLLRLKNPQAYFDSERRAEERADTRETADTQTFATMAASADPRVRALGIAGLQKTKTFGPLASTVQGLGKPLVGTGAEFVASPEVQSEITTIGQQLSAAGNDTNAEQLALALKPRIDRLVSLATEKGADPNQVLQDILGQLAKAAPASSLYSNPITTTLGAIPGVRSFVPEPSRDAARRAVGIR